MGGQSGIGSGDNNFDEEGYDESQRAEILEATRDGPSDGNLITDLRPDLGGDIDDEDEDDVTELLMEDGEVGEETDTITADEDDDDDEDDLQEDFDNDEVDDDTLDDGDDVALRP